MKYEIFYTVKGLLPCFRDVVEVQNIDDCEAELTKLVEHMTGSRKSIRIVLIKQIEGA